MATGITDDYNTEANLGTLSPTDLEVLDIFNFNSASKDKQPNAMFQPQKKLDDELMMATMTVLITGKLTPLIKQELKFTIQNRRLMRGEEELNVDLTPATPSPPLSPDEEAVLEAKKETRRERNRIAALKCRRKRRQEMSMMVEQCGALEKKNEELKQTLSRMEEERDQMLALLSEIAGCPFHIGGANSNNLMGGASSTMSDMMDSSTDAIWSEPSDSPLSCYGPIEFDTLSP